MYTALSFALRQVQQVRCNLELLLELPAVPAGVGTVSLTVVAFVVSEAEYEYEHAYL